MPPARARPLSPHLQVYRWQIGNTLSILHRLTGVALALGIIALSYWLISLAGGQAAYEGAMRLYTSVFGFIALFGWTFSFMYHLLNGVRHLIWDAGYGFDKTQRHATGWLAVVGALVLTAGVCLIVWHGVRS